MEIHPSYSSSYAGKAFLGVDVGTGSARAGLFSEDGRLLGSASSLIQIWKDGDSVEQSSTDIWHAICAAVKAVCSLANVTAEDVIGLGFAATCSLVAVDADGSPVTVSCSGDARRNIIVWIDHRSVKQAEKINSFNSTVLQYCGGSVSPEMQPPKLLWVKENLKESWSMAFRWMDLSDWLSFRATGDDTRSLCTTVCKWTYLGHAHMHQIDTLLACGGLAKNSLYIQEHADIVGCSIILPRENESVLLGAAILGSVATKKYSGLHDAMKALSAAGQVVHPSKDERVKKYHDAKYEIYKSLYEQQLSHRTIMQNALQ
ncbi:Ribulokinase [Zostera marina]|uniref:Ribulokinase n=1 Tax=Zostera marina TaxID=29655 RepID=A0A0K9PYA9_ZOSMR|nr:Ribulokinase [Zostera marina]